MDAYAAFGLRESSRDGPLYCAECGREAEGNVSCEDGPICDACDKEGS